MDRMIIAAVFFAVAAVILLTVLICQDQRIRKLSQQIDDYLAGRVPPLNFSVREDSLARLHNAIAELQDRQETLRENLHLESQRTGDLIADISHQLKTPLSALKLYCEMDESHHMSRQIDQIERMEGLIHALLRLERLCANGYDFNFDIHAVDEIARNAWNDLKESWPGTAMHIEGASRIRCDAQWLEEVFSNLFKNACEQMSGCGSITVRMENTDQSFFCTVEDEGGGVSRKDLPNLFRRFYRTKNASAKGAGLGLAIVREIIERHHGHVQASNTESGLRISMTIPVLNLVESRLD